MFSYLRGILFSFICDNDIKIKCLTMFIDCSACTLEIDFIKPTTY